MNKIRATALGIIGFGFFTGVHAADFAISSFGRNGDLTWTGVPVGATCRVEWASSLTSAWSSTWTNLIGIVVTNDSMTVTVPMFYRVICQTGDFTNGLALYLPFSGNLDDLSGNGTDGTNFGTTLTADKAGLASNACYFNGSGTEVDVPDADSLDVTNITLSFWFNLESQETAASEAVNKFGWPPEISYGTEIRSNDKKLYFRISTDGPGGGLTDLASTSTIAMATWYHVAGTYDGNEMRLYINGVRESATSKSGPITISWQPVQIGRYGYSAAHSFHGVIDEVAIWNRAMTEMEIRLLYLKGGKP